MLFFSHSLAKVDERLVVRVISGRLAVGKKRVKRRHAFQVFIHHCLRFTVIELEGQGQPLLPLVQALLQLAQDFKFEGVRGIVAMVLPDENDTSSGLVYNKI